MVYLHRYGGSETKTSEKGEKEDKERKVSESVANTPYLYWTKPNIVTVYELLVTYKLISPVISFIKLHFKE